MAGRRTIDEKMKQAEKNVESQDILEHPHFLNFSLANRQGVVYNQCRNNHRIFAVSDDCHRKLNGVAFKLVTRLSPIAVGDSRFTFCGDRQGM